MAEKPETKFRKKVDQFLKTLKHTYAMSIQQVSLRGHPDKVLSVNGRFVALELKAAGGRATKLQEYTLNQIRKSGGYALVVSPENWPQVTYWLAALDQGEENR